jgi:multicomponent K+:H+ antiporter subunit G
MDLILEILIAASLVVSGIFGFVGSYGLVKLRNTMQRLHAPTKATTLGVGGVLIASILYFYLDEGKVSFHELLITFFLFMTAPVTANFIAKTHLAERADETDLPDTQRDVGWAIYDDPPEQS